MSIRYRHEAGALRALPRKLVRPLAALAFALVAVTALAFTVQELSDRAVALDAQYDDLLARVVEAEPSEEAALASEFDDLEVDRAQLEADRATLGSCSCTALDDLLATIQGTSGTIQVIIDSWDEG